MVFLFYRLFSFFFIFLIFSWWQSITINQINMICYVDDNDEYVNVIIDNWWICKSSSKNKTSHVVIANKIQSKKNLQKFFAIIVLIKKFYVKLTIILFIILFVSSWIAREMNVTLIMSFFDSFFINQFLLHYYSCYWKQCQHHSKSDWFNLETV